MPPPIIGCSSTRRGLPPKRIPSGAGDGGGGRLRVGVCGYPGSVGSPGQQPYGFHLVEHPRAADGVTDPSRRGRSRAHYAFRP
jgi:hypothetical protein